MAKPVRPILSHSVQLDFYAEYSLANSHFYCLPKYNYIVKITLGTNLITERWNEGNENQGKYHYYHHHRVAAGAGSDSDHYHHRRRRCWWLVGHRHGLNCCCWWPPLSSDVTGNESTGTRGHYCRCVVDPWHFQAGAIAGAGGCHRHRWTTLSEAIVINASVHVKIPQNRTTHLSNPRDGLQTTKPNPEAAQARQTCA